MNFVLQTPSLQHLSGVKLVTHLWSQRDIFIQIAGLPEHHLREDRMQWKAIEEKVKNKISDLPLPETCKKQLFNLIIPLGMEIIYWCRYHCEGKIDSQFLDNFVPEQLCWTMHGTVDYTKTAVLMVKNEKMDVERRYEIACINCLEEEARQLFESMDEQRRQEYVNRVRSVGGMFYLRYLIVYFTCTLSGGDPHSHKRFQAMTLRRHSSLNKCLIEIILRCGNRTPIEYFLKKLNHREKDQVLEECQILLHSDVHNESCSNGGVLYFLSLMNAEQQSHMFGQGRLTYHLLMFFLDWPLQSLSVEAAQCGWPLMDNRRRTKVLRGIIFKIWCGFGDFDYSQLFWECWRLTSAEYNKQHYLCDVQLFRALLYSKREEWIELILNEAPSRQMDESFNEIGLVLTDESSITNAALMECKETAALIGASDKEDVEKRLRSEYVSRLVDMAIERRKRRLI